MNQNRFIPVLLFCYGTEDILLLLVELKALSRYHYPYYWFKISNPKLLIFDTVVKNGLKMFDIEPADIVEIMNKLKRHRC